MAWWMLGVLLVLQATASLAQFSYAVLIPFLRADLLLSAAQVGALPGVMFAGQAATNTFTGMLVDRMGVRTAIATGPALFVASLFVVALASDYWAVLLGLGLAGATFGFVTPLIAKAILLWFPVRLRGLMFGVKQSGVTLGVAMGAVILPPVAVRFGWQAGFAAAGGLVVLAIVLCLAVYRDPAGRAEARLAPPSLAGSMALVRDPIFLAVLSIGFTFAAYQVVVSTFLIPYVHDALGLSVVAAAGFLSLSQLVAALARPAMGWLGDRIGWRPAMVAGALLAAASGVWLGLMPAAGATASLWLAVAGQGAGAFGWAGLYYVVLAELAGPSRTGVATGLGSAVSSVGAAVGPFVFGLVVDMAGHRPALVWSSLILGVCAGIAWFLPSARPASRPAGRP